MAERQPRASESRKERGHHRSTGRRCRWLRKSLRPCSGVRTERLCDRVGLGIGLRHRRPPRLPRRPRENHRHRRLRSGHRSPRGEHGAAGTHPTPAGTGHQRAAPWREGHPEDTREEKPSASRPQSDGGGGPMPRPKRHPLHGGICPQVRERGSGRAVPLPQRSYRRQRQPSARGHRQSDLKKSAFPAG